MSITSKQFKGFYKAFKSVLRSPPGVPQAEPSTSDLDSDLDIIERVIVEDLASSGCAAEYSGLPGPSSPTVHSQLPQEAHQLDGSRDNGINFIYFEEGDASIAPVCSTSRAVCLSFPHSIITEPYHVTINDVSPLYTGRVSRQVSNGPYVEIDEQPERSKRFRYETASDLTSVGVIHGVKSIKNGKKTFPAIKIGNHEGPATITVSLVDAEYPHRVHPNGLVSKKSSTSDKYIYVKHVEVTRQNCIFPFENLGIRLVKHEQVNDALNLRELQKVDPFNQGYGNRVFSTADLQKVRLCFQVELAPQKLLLPPVISDVIHDSRKLGCLQIKMLCSCRGSNKGGPRIILVCDRMNPKDIEVVFYEGELEAELWRQSVTMKPDMEVFACTTIVCTVPAYTRAVIEPGAEVQVNIRLRRPSDNTYSDPRLFTYYADNPDLYYRNKRKRADEIIEQYVQENWTPPSSVPESDCTYLSDQVYSVSPKPSGSREPTPANICSLPMSPDVEPIPHTSLPMTMDEDSLLNFFK